MHSLALVLPCLFYFSRNLLSRSSKKATLRRTHSCSSDIALACLIAVIIGTVVIFTLAASLLIGAWSMNYTTKTAKLYLQLVSDVLTL
ncbi:hypothetical protein CPB83DRAFT_852890 [Crepidotus variabilis]|uniref:Uncharacterized protein n=1 Tax=Crepidotus variabilis TaxID=179855 RepID=A0A9P6EHX2_9AGAR|nr:hypothetical protein CPB83DRAFT_852890 [Crepidotus variabilis]